MDKLTQARDAKLNRISTVILELPELILESLLQKKKSQY